MYEKRNPPIESPFRAPRTWVVLFGTLALFCTGCAKPEPTTLESARVELRRVLDIWKNGKFYVAGEIGKGARSAEGHDIDRFFPLANMWRDRLVSYEILDGRENKPGEFELRVSQTRSSILYLNPATGKAKKTTTAKYHVYRGKSGKWLVVDSRLEAARRRLSDRRGGDRDKRSRP